MTLRGHFTQHVLSSLGYSDTFVSGCPSMYYKREKLFITNNKLSRNDFNPCFNGFLENNYCNGLNKYKNSVFFDQDIYYKLLWHGGMITDSELEKIATKELVDLYKNKRVRNYRDIKAWIEEYRKLGINFSYGQRIHANILAILCGIPSFVDVIDSRTREIAEFYKIPNSYSTNFNIRKDSLYDLYNSLNYDEFNRNYQVMFNNFRNFLTKNKLVGEKNLQVNNKFNQLYECIQFSTCDFSVDEKLLKKMSKFAYKKKIKFYLKRIIFLMINFIPVRKMRHLLRSIYVKSSQ